MTRQNTASLFEKMDSRLRGNDEDGAGHVIRVAFESGVDCEFDYLVPDKLWPLTVGQRVETPFGRTNKLEIGFCVETDVNRRAGLAPPLVSPQACLGVEAEHKKKFKLKTISDVIDKEPLIDAGLMELARWISDYYVCPLGVVLGAMVPAAVKKGAGEKKEKYVYLAVGPEDIEKVVAAIKGKKQKQVVQQLRSSNAFESQTAVELNELLEQADCTDLPLKNLVEKEIVKIAQRTVLRSLPAIPEGMLIRSEKVILNDDQQKSLTHIIGKINSPGAPGFGVTLLYGVTDSGKTELYIRAIDEVLKKGKTAIVMLPEIALTTQTIQRFIARFERIAIMHSGLTAPQRNTQWQKIKACQANVVIGARSAVFAPLTNIGLIIVDEEHEPSYKQDTAPRYHGRDVAIKRAQLCNAHCILGSATPSLETLQNCLTRKNIFTMVRLPKRVMDLPFPEMRLVDMKNFASSKDGISLLSEPLTHQLSEVLSRREQAILLLNRRGYSNFIFCPSCKHILQCRNCDVTLTFHKTPGRNIAQIPTITGKHIQSGSAICHYCGSQTLVPEKCPLCGKTMIMIGLGAQRLEEELAKKFPRARVARVDSDSMKGTDYYRVLREFSEGKINVLAGTQILAKGLHFPNVTLVGIISADTSLYLPDFRANERTFQLISQVAGRAGRSAKKGIVFVQTFLPDQPAIQFALKSDFDGFVREELKHRKICNLPPFWRLALITLRDRTFEKLESAAKLMREKIDGIVSGENLQIKVRGPMPAIISRIQTFHRLQIILQAPSPSILLQLFSILRKSPPIRPAVDNIAIDLDPVDLL